MSLLNHLATQHETSLMVICNQLRYTIVLSACLQATTISEFRFRTPKSYPKNPCWAWGTHTCLQVNKNNQSFILTLRPQNCSRHPATRITLDTRPPQLLCRLLPSTSWGSLLIHIVGPGYHGRGGRLGGGRRVLLLSLSSY